MQNEELKTKMKELWKNTFRDSDEYISLIFDNYFNPEFIEYFEEDNKLVSALLGIPYYFSNGRDKIQGLYLCGLATVPEYRQHGIMSKLISDINNKALQKGFPFTFLIPANDMLRIYYSTRGFENAIYSVEDRYTQIHNFKNDYISSLNGEDDRVIILKKKYFENLIVSQLEISDKSTLDDVTDFMIKIENSEKNFSVILHNKIDAEIAIKENKISGGSVLFCKNNEGKITGVLFATFDERKRIQIPKIYHEDTTTYFKLLDKIKTLYPDLSMSVYCFPEETDRRVLWSQIYVAASQDGTQGSAYGIAERVYDVNRHAKPYGMVNILDIREILKFIAKDRGDCKFSILVKDAVNENLSLKCDVKDGKALFSEIPNDLIKKYNNDPNITVLSKRDLSEILFRKKDNNSMIMEALGIPRMALNMALMLD